MKRLTKFRAGCRRLVLASALIGIVLAPPLAAQHLAANWISNGEFDASIDGWTAVAAVNWDGSVGSPQEGAMRLVRFFSVSGQSNASQCFPRPLPMTGPYRLTARVLTDSVPWLIMVESFVTTDCTGIAQQFVIADTAGAIGDWTQVQTPPFQFTVPSASIRVIVRPIVIGEMWVDHVKFGPLRAYQAVVSGPGDYLHPGAAQPWDDATARIVVFEQRVDTLPATGDLYVTRSDDHGLSWTVPTVAVAGSGRDSSPSLVQTGAAAWSLFHHSNASGLFRIHQAVSGDGSSFGIAAPVDLGWGVHVEQFGPHAVRAPDGSLSMTYSVAEKGVFLARSQDDGASWDHLRTLVGAGHTSRIAYRASDNTWLLVIGDAGLWVKTSQDPYDWSAPAQPLSLDPEATDPYPVLLADDSFAIAWSAPVDGAYQLFTARSADGSNWERTVRHTDTTLERHNVHPAVLPGSEPGTVDLYWAAAQATASEYQIVSLAGARVTDELFADGFETP